MLFFPSVEFPEPAYVVMDKVSMHFSPSVSGSAASACFERRLALLRQFVGVNIGGRGFTVSSKTAKVSYLRGKANPFSLLNLQSVIRHAGSVSDWGNEAFGHLASRYASTWPATPSARRETCCMTQAGNLSKVGRFGLNLGFSLEVFREQRGHPGCRSVPLLG